MKNNYIFIGMPGSGKTTFGKMLAAELKMDFLDFDDDIIELGEEQSVEELLGELGEVNFIRFEENLALELDFTNTILSASGSLPLSQKAMNHLSTLWKIIYMKPPIEEIESRIWEMNTERIVGFPQRTLEEIFVERERYFDEVADVIFEYEWENKAKIYSDLKKELWLQ